MGVDIRRSLENSTFNSIIKGTPPAEDIVTGFEGQSDVEIRQYFHQFLAAKGTMGKITRIWFAVLD